MVKLKSFNDKLYLKNYGFRGIFHRIQNALICIGVVVKHDGNDTRR